MHWRDEVGQFLRVIAVVAVEEDHDVAAGRTESVEFGHAAQAGRTVTAMVFMHHNRAMFARDFGGAVRRTVVHHHHLRHRRPWDFVDDRTDSILFIERRNQDERARAGGGRTGRAAALAAA